MASKNDIQKLFNEVNITPILKDIGIFLSHNDKVGNFLSEIIIKNIESNDTIKKEFLKGINNLDILQDAIPISSKLMGKTLENETDTNKLYEALKLVIFSDFKEKVASVSNIEQVKQLDKEEINKYLNVAKILSSSLIKSETFPTIQELITVLHKHKSTTQTILSNSIAIFSNKDEESAKKLSETNKMLDHNEVFETLKSPLNNKHVKYITSNPESLQLVLNMAIEPLPKLSEIIQELDKQKELDNILSLMQNISNVKNQDIANKIIDIIETPQNTKIKQILTEDIPNILSKDSKSLS
ncbi:hypothetical protein [Rickettsia endosymbiont of Pantilius tunicatus]|uniref:hypothetical protein n=1 Tax=Rickettsia endosymbiont of Pantilius tunicatus TaxID=3066267 RepID=UPI00376F0EE7